MWLRSLTSWQPVILWKTLVLYLREHKIVKSTHEKKTAKVSLGLTLIFIISYVPFHICELYFYFCIYSAIYGTTKEDEIVLDNNFKNISIILYIFLLINSCLNPVLLFCTSLAFRRQFKRYLTCCCKPNSPPTKFELKRRNWVCILRHYLLQKN